MATKRIISVGWFFDGWAALWSDNVIRGCNWQTVAKHHLVDYDGMIEQVQQ